MGKDEREEDIEHIVAIDYNSRLLFDCAEEYAMRLYVPVFNACVGDGFKFEAVTGLCELVSQPVGEKI